MTEGSPRNRDKGQERLLTISGVLSVTQSSESQLHACSPHGAGYCLDSVCPALALAAFLALVTSRVLASALGAHVSLNTRVGRE